jgi:hypothetical protein
MANGDQQEFLLWIIKNKYDALADADAYLTGALSDPTNNRTLIENRLDEDNLERSRLLAKQDAIKAGNFNFPSTGDIETLRTAIANLETMVAQSAKVDKVIQAAATVMSKIPASSI